MMTISRIPRALCAVSFAACMPVLVMAMLSATPVGAEQSAIDQMITTHNAGRDGDVKAAARAVEGFEAFVKAYPDNALASAYLGSSYALMARDASFFVSRIRYTNRGLRYLDAAVEMAPGDFVVRVIRANVTARLPAIFDRGDTAVEDMMALDAMFEAARTPYMADQMVEIYGHLAELAPGKSDWVSKAQIARVMAEQ